MLIGKLSAPAPLHFRSLQLLKIRALIHRRSYEAMVTLNVGCKEDLRWWLLHLELMEGKAIITPSPDFVLETDASLTGWGAEC